MKTLQERFESKINRTSSCWEWTGYVSNSGYGRFGVGKPQKIYFAHRISYELYVGPIPNNLCVLHKCDNRKCVNPKHLWLGTHKDNRIDCVNKKRNNPQAGSNNGFSKLTESKVKQIRKLYKPRKITCKSLALRFKVHESTVRYILRGVRWK